jgi:hypothetical protein
VAQSSDWHCECKKEQYERRNHGGNNYSSVQFIFFLFWDNTGSFIKSTQEGAEDRQNQIKENSFDELAILKNQIISSYNIYGLKCLFGLTGHELAHGDCDIALICETERHF